MDDKNYNIVVWKRKNKKYDVFKNGKYLLWFGDKRYEQYRDKLGHYKHLDHNDKKRRDYYYNRNGETNDKDTAKYWANLILW